MSLYTVSRDATADDCVEAALCMYYQQEYPSKHMDKSTYCSIAQRQIKGCPALIVYEEGCDDIAIAWMTYTIDLDLHFPGKGGVVYNLVVDKYFPEALPVLMREFRRILLAEDCEWYQTTRRVGETELVSKFRRLRNGQEST